MKNNIIIFLICFVLLICYGIFSELYHQIKGKTFLKNLRDKIINALKNLI